MNFLKSILGHDSDEDEESSDPETCREMIDFSSRKIVILYSNPYFNLKKQKDFEKDFERKQEIEEILNNIKPLKSFTREMRFVYSLLNPFDFYIQPATTVKNFEYVLDKYQPEIVVWAGHTIRDRLVFEHDNGSAYEADNLNNFVHADKITEMLRFSGNLKLIVLMGCNTEPIGRIIHKKRKDLGVICWSTLVEDEAASVFVQGMLNKLQNYLHGHQELGKTLIREIYEAGLNEFKIKFILGDPQTKSNSHGQPILFN